jgi:hypothetical protein
MQETAIFTTSSNNYFAFVKTLLQSVRDFHDDIDLYFLLVDETADERMLDQEDLFRLCLVKDIGIADYKKMAFAYDMVEFNTAVKPFFVNYLFNQGYKKVIYLDPDILVCDRLDAALDALANHSIIVTPHQLSPVTDVDRFVSYLQWEQSALLTGIFNLGFIGVANSLEGRAFVDWWSNRCKYMAFVDPGAGLFVDQKWVNLAMCFYPSTYILRHKGYNMCVWNLHDRVLIDGRVNGVEPLVFYHFSSIDMNDPEIISKHDMTLKLKDRPDLIDLARSYRERVQHNGYDHFHGLPYTYDYFSEGRKIDLLERRLYSAVSENFPDPFSTPSNEFYAELKKKRRSGTVTSCVRNQVLIERIAKAVLKTTFKIVGAKQYADIMRWFNVAGRLRNHTFLLD